MKLSAGLLLGHYLRKARWRRRVNVNSKERLVSTLAGLALTAFALRRGRGWVGRLLGTVGAGLLARRGMTGRCDLYRSLGVRST